MKLASIVTLVLGGVLGQSAAAQQHLRLIENFLVENASRDGSVLVGRDRQSSAIRWSESGTTVIYDQRSGVAEVISADGTYIGGHYTDRQGRTMLFRWTEAGGFESLGNAGANSLAPRGITDDGRTMVGTYSIDSGEGAFRWTPEDGIRALPLGFGGEAVAITGDGRTYAGSRFDGANTEAIRVTDGQVQGLGGGSLGSRAYNMSSNGDFVVGWWGSRGTAGRTILTASVWRDGESELLGTLSGYYGSLAHSVSDDGSIITGVCSTQNGQPAPEDDFVWTASTGIIGFTEYATLLGYELLPNYTYSDIAVSRDGTVIYGRYNYWPQDGGPIGAGSFTMNVPSPGVLPLAAAMVVVTRRRRAGCKLL